jgi:site-specific recombinase XerD
MSINEAERLLAMTGSLRDNVMLSLGYGCGLRAGEIVRLKVGDIDSGQMIIRIVQSKARKDRHVMLPEELLQSLREWWRVRPTRFDADVPVKERWLFPGRRKGQHLTYRQLSRVFHETAAAAGITKRISLHSLRHSFATELLEKGIGIRYIQALLGHSKLDTTSRYTRVATGRIAAIDSPLKHLGPGARHRKLRKKHRGPKAA